MKWHPSIHMPKEAARIFLKVKDVREERLQDITEEVDMKRKTNGELLHCYLYVNSHYFERRECISFNPDGFIGFAGWADQGNTNPILRAFVEWCDLVAEQI